MIKPDETGPRAPDEPPKSETSVGKMVVERVFGLFAKIVDGAFDRFTLIVLIVASLGAYCFWIYNLPPEQRAAHGPDQVLRAIQSLLANDLFAWGGWVFGAVVAFVSFVVVRVVLRRNRTQGAALRDHRSREDVGRLSSENPLLKDAVDNVLKQSPLNQTAKSGRKQLDLDYSPPPPQPRKEE